MRSLLEPQSILPVFMYDLDGMLIDTDLNDPLSAKGLETRDILENHGIELDDVTFREFYRTFNTEAAGTTMRIGAETLVDLLEKEFGISLDREELYKERKRERIETYRRRARFIGDDMNNNGLWLARLPAAIQESHYLVTNAKREGVDRLDENPSIRIGSRSVYEHFGDRTITLDDVCKKKPDPEMYDLVLKRACPEPNARGIAGIAFEDSQSGIAAAKDARDKIYVVGIGSHAGEEELMDYGADHYAPALHEIDVHMLLDMAGYG